MPAHLLRSPGEVVNDLVSVVIVNYNGMDLLEKCLRSVYAQPYRPIEVIVVDNASTDGSMQFIGTRFPEARCIFQTRNLGFAAGSNTGVAEASGEYVVLLNNDTVVKENWLPGLIDMMRRPGVGVVASRVITEGIPEEDYAMNGTLNFLGYNVMRVFTDLSMVFYASAASLMFRKSVVGLPFRDEYFLYHEDVYLSWRLRLQGYDIRMAQASVVHHRGSVTTKRHTSALISFFQHRNRLLNCLLFYEKRTLLALVPYFLGDAVAVLFLGMARRRKSARGVLRAYVWLARNRRWVRFERSRLQLERTRGDAEIMKGMSHRVLNGTGLLAGAANGLALLYARMTGLKHA